MTAFDVVVCVVFAVSLVGCFAGQVVYGRPAARPDKFPIPPGCHPKAAHPPSYRDPAPRTIEDRLDALERAEAARTLREMGEPSDELDTELAIALKQLEYRRQVKEAKR